MARLSISEFLDDWIPELKQGYSQGGVSGDPQSSITEDRIRARALLGLYFSFSVILLVGLVLFGAWHAFTENDFTPTLILFPILIVILGLQILMFYRLGNVNASAAIFSMTFFGLTLGALIFTGGWESPIKIIFFCCPIVSFLIGGKQEGLYMGFLVFVSGLAAYASGKVGLQLFHIDRPENREIIAVTAWVISMILMTCCLAVYDELFRDFVSKESRR